MRSAHGRRIQRGGGGGGKAFRESVLGHVEVSRKLYVAFVRRPD